MGKFDEGLIKLHNQIDDDIYHLTNILGEIDSLYPKGPLPEYTGLLYLNYISLSELTFSIKEYFLLKDIIIHNF
jgi:hypothetical protein